MNQNKFAIMALAGAMAVSVPVLADPTAKNSHNSQRANSQQRFTDTAKVTFVEPIYRRVRINRPERECWDEDRSVDHRHGGGNKTAGGIIGGILGGVAGHQVGKGKGKTAATIVGTIIGGSIGRDMADNGGPRVETHVDTRTTCRTVNNYVEEERLRGYRVNYRYNGREYETFMKRRPGKRIDVRVKVIPLVD